jgi:hypothetical protein
MEVLLWRTFVFLWFGTYLYLRRKEPKNLQEDEQEPIETKQQSPNISGKINSSGVKISENGTSKTETHGNNSISATASTQNRFNGASTTSNYQGNSKTSAIAREPSAASEHLAPTTSTASSISPKQSGYYEFDRGIHVEIRPGMEKNLDKINKLRSLIIQQEPSFATDTWVLSDQGLWRYLVARNYDIEAAKKQALAALKWRSTKKPWETRATELKLECQTGKSFLRGADRHGRPVIVLDSTKENTYDTVANMKLLTYTIDRAIRRMEPPVDKYVIVFRLSDLNIFNFSKMPSAATVRETIKILMNVYAERLGHGIVWQPPKIFQLFLNVFHSLMDPHVVSKAVWISGDTSPGSNNDRALCELLGSHWRELIGEGMPTRPKCSPGYDPEAEYRAIEEEDARLFPRAQ